VREISPWENLSENDGDAATLNPSEISTILNENF